MLVWFGKILLFYSILFKMWIYGAKAHRVSTEVVFRYLEMGNSDNPTILVLHGFSDTKESFLSIGRILAKKYHLIIPDLPGFGISGKPKEATYDLEQYTNWIIEFIDKLNLTNFHLLGHSLGGSISSRVSLQISEKIQTLCLFSSGGIVPQPSVGIYKQLEEGKNIFAIQNMKEFEFFLGNNFYRPPFLPLPIKAFVFSRYQKNFDWYSKIMTDLTGGEKEMKVTPELLDQHSLNDKIAGVSVPTLLVWGDKDLVFPLEVAKMFEEKIPHAQLKIIKDCGHCINWETPRKSMQIYEKFLGEHNDNG